MTCTIYKDIFSLSTPHYISVNAALARIKNGKSKQKVEEIRAALDKEKQDALKRQLPSVCFSGKFQSREDSKILEHSGFIVLDFDDVENIDELAAKICSDTFTYACWLSPRGNGLKMLIRIADGKRHREHFAAIREKYPEIDKSGVNESRVCYESYDPNIYINEQAEVFKKTLVIEKIESKKIIDDERAVFKNLLAWQANKGGAFVKGERNAFIFKLAGACCRFGLNEDSAESLILSEYPPSNDFTTKEAINTIRSAYKRNNSSFGTAQFIRDILVDKATRKEINIDPEVYDESVAPRDIIYGDSIIQNAINLYCDGYAKVSGIGVKDVDDRWKSKKGELTGITGIGNYGKSAFYKWIKCMRMLLYGEKFVAFVPEDNPPEEYYLDFVEILLGRICTPTLFDGSPNKNKPTPEQFINAYKFVSKHVFYLGPKEAPSLDYLFERFLEMVIKEKISGCVIDPWNQVLHDYIGFGANVSKYLEYALARASKFAQTNDIYFDIILHPRAMTKNSTGNYECPDVFEMNDGAMWNNKLDNLLVYHRPFAQTDRANPLFEFHSKKIKRQKIVGRPGMSDGVYVASTRRFEFGGIDHMQNIININKLDFSQEIDNYQPKLYIPPEPIFKAAQEPPPNPSAGIRPINYRDQEGQSEPPF